MTRIGTVSPFLFDDNLIIALTKDWLDKFSKIPTFDVVINNAGRLCLTSTECIKK